MEKSATQPSDSKSSDTTSKSSSEKKIANAAVKKMPTSETKIVPRTRRTIKRRRKFTTNTILPIVCGAVLHLREKKGASFSQVMDLLKSEAIVDDGHEKIVQNALKKANKIELLKELQDGKFRPLFNSVQTIDRLIKEHCHSCCAYRKRLLINYQSATKKRRLQGGGGSQNKPNHRQKTKNHHHQHHSSRYHKKQARKEVIPRKGRRSNQKVILQARYQPKKADASKTRIISPSEFSFRKITENDRSYDDSYDVSLENPLYDAYSASVSRRKDHGDHDGL